MPEVRTQHTHPSLHVNITCMWSCPLMDLSVFLSSGWQRRKVSTRCLSTTWQRCLGRPCWGLPRRTARSPLTPPNPSAWGTAGPWKLWHRWATQIFFWLLIFEFCDAFSATLCWLQAWRPKSSFYFVSLLFSISLQVQVLLYFLQLETIPTPDSKRQSILFSTEV